MQLIYLKKRLVSHCGGFGFNPTPLHVGSVVHKVSLRQVFLRELRFPAVSVILQILQNNLFIYHRCHLILGINGVVKWHTSVPHLPMWCVWKTWYWEGCFSLYVAFSTSM